MGSTTNPNSLTNYRMAVIRTLILLAAWTALAQAKSMKYRELWRRDVPPILESGEDDSDDVDDELDSRVIGGRDAKEDEFPYMCALHYKGRLVCSSFLITPNVVMTAAHCVQFDEEPEDPEDFTGYVGTLDRDGPDQKVTFTKIIAPEDYGYDTEWDLALLFTEKPVVMDEKKVQTICLPSNNSLYENMTAQVVGWGVTEKWGHRPAKTLQTAEEKVPTWEQCEWTYSILGIPVTRRHICAGGDKDKGVCFGDSGGPLVTMNEGKPVALGVASFVSYRGCAKEKIPAVYTYLPTYLDWITKNMGKEEAERLCIREKGNTTPPLEDRTP